MFHVKHFLFAIYLLYLFNMIVKLHNMFYNVELFYKYLSRYHRYLNKYIISITIAIA